VKAAATASVEAACRGVQRRFALLHLALPLASLLALVAGIGLGIAWVARIGALGFAAGLIAVGVLAIHERRVLYWNEIVSNHVAIVVHRGVAAVLMGSAIILGGLLVLAIVAAHALGASVAEMRGLLLSRPGLALVPIGAMLMLFGLSFVLGYPGGRDAGKSALLNALLGLPSRLGGVILVVWGLAAFGAGAFELLRPDAFDRSVRGLFATSAHANLYASAKRVRRSCAALVSICGARAANSASTSPSSAYSA